MVALTFVMIDREDFRVRGCREHSCRPGVGTNDHGNDRDCGWKDCLERRDVEKWFEHNQNSRTQEASGTVSCRNSGGISTREAVDDESGPQRKKGKPVQGA